MDKNQKKKITAQEKLGESRSTSVERKELEAKIAELTAGWQRTQADFLNFKKQAANDRLRLIKSANSDLVHQLLTVLDHFQLAARHIPKDLENHNWAQGIRQIERQFEKILADNGLEHIESVGQQFNPELHEAVEEVESEKPEGEIVEEILAGYKFADSVLRPAKVKVSKGK
ncbi:nucleotide exchange factor GrpE [Candidatus Berkelbacteria bacterium CG1_02_42_45]|uniref:Protein GrpE n=5 Tax=Candidatus Berkelbacteria TaxID=1618330 RepID=A0A2M7K261_9BACT|nr:MAG: nucleotide exchange factor GrpE [Candidatus Berkelbacteria bacterium CG1_02_42_45]PIP50762.1 MAG: nucleotide exchange factor GrpE [Candidatus Berkelbacteria bacterium CG23_combo_of_CG06-09_8_20_14_all_41_73]PIR27518.1 MAG: nucleotide exchange factor GrpE [Candidatus Berkelbacteria bacterium CG11_big_fil_rev_8_21_14_0_20_42_15]PIX30319.1 MAG: nucleotide exchange factor GrpE [Candidatus Berkelbacteria bacterium CG_4_8_14_3_um_filter_42_13]PIZ27835.1 MAG: nucleotide exchange factor GrpE [C